MSCEVQDNDQSSSQSETRNNTVPTTGVNLTRALGNRPPDHDRIFFSKSYENELGRQGHKVSRRKNRNHEIQKQTKSGGLPRIPVDLDSDNEFRKQEHFSDIEKQEHELHTENSYSHYNEHSSPRHRRGKEQSRDRNDDLHEYTNGDVVRKKSRSKDRLSSHKHRRTHSDATPCTRTVSNGGPVNRQNNGFPKEKLRSTQSSQSKPKQGSRKSNSDTNRFHILNECNGDTGKHHSRKTHKVGKISSVKDESPREMTTLPNKISIDSYDIYPRNTNRAFSSECQSIASDGDSKNKKRSGFRKKSYNQPRRDKPSGSSCCGFKTSQRRCLTTLLVISVVITLALVAAGFVIYTSIRGGNKDSLLYDMVRAHVQLCIINRPFTFSLQNPNSTEFRTLDNNFCREIDLRYLTSALYFDYFGCSLQTARNGSINIYFMSTFLDTELTSNISIHRDILLKNGYYIPAGSGETTLSSDSAHKVALGEFIIEVNSTEIFLEKYTTDRLPPRPRLSKPVTKTPGQSAAETETVLPIAHENGIRETNGVSKNMGNIPYSTTASTITDPATGGGDGYKHWTKTKVMDLQSSTISVPRYISSGGTTSLPRNVVRIEAGEATLGEKAAIICLISAAGNVRSLTITKTDQKKQMSVVVILTDDQLKTNTSKTLNSKSNVNINTHGDSLAVSLNFSSIQCEDIGEYKCYLKTETDTYESSIGKLDGTEPPERPLLSLPHDLVENRELSKPITCSANVGFPPGYIQWLIKPKGSTSFFPFEGNYVNVSGACNNHVTKSLIYTPTKDGNGTLLKCVVINHHVTVSTDLTVMAEIEILPENLCDHVPTNTLIRHPFTCTKYIRCDGKNYEVLECDNQMCFDEESGKCGQISLTMPSVTAILNDGVALIKCYLVHKGDWNSITISKLDTSGDKTKILTASKGGMRAIYGESPMQGRMHVYVDETKQYQVEVSLWIELTCQDGGQYTCEADAPYKIPVARGDVIVQVQPSAPTLSIPNEIIEGAAMRTNITCEADVGFPFGSLVLKVKRPGETEYAAVAEQLTIFSEIQNCSQIVTASFAFLPRLDHNGMMVRCELENNDTLPLDHKFIAEEKIHVIPANFCQSVGDQTIREHPYDCHQYVSCLGGYIYVQRCGSSLCFDPNTLRCDKEDETETTFDPRQPCKPDKNGVFFRHPVLCNKFFWCVQGKEVVKHCPSGTLYIDGGQCTFEPERSLCYQEKALI